MQANSFRVLLVDTAGGNNNLKTGFKQLMVSIVRNEGVAGLYRGVGPTMVKSCVGSGVTFAVFRGTCSALEGKKRLD